ncbi:MAG: hemolysin family protein [Cytophagaceae bacterium]|nr:hemolysin family protein [Cytophagaceae bacterium]
MLVEIIIILLLIVINGVFAMSEIAIVSSRKSKLEVEAEEGNTRAGEALKISESPHRFLSTVQVGITLIGILTGVFGGASISGELSSWLKNFEAIAPYSEGIAILIVVLLITYFSLVIGELVPKRIGLSDPEKIASLVASPMNLIAKITHPAVWLLLASTDLIIKIFGIKPSTDNAVTEEEIKALVQEATDVGEVEKAEQEIVERVFFLGDADVGSLMTPRMDIIALDIDEDFDVNKKIIIESIHTNFIVFSETIDNVVGVLNLKKLVPAALQSGNTTLKDLLSPALFIPEKTSAFKLLESMKKSRSHFAIAVSEHGSVTGVVTINDLFKALVGNLYNDNKEPEIVQREDGSYLVDGLISLDEFFRYFEIEDTDEIHKQGFFTLGGFVLYISKKIPGVAEKFSFRNLTLEIIDMDGTRVDKVLVKKDERIILSDQFSADSNIA